MAEENTTTENRAGSDRQSVFSNESKNGDSRLPRWALVASSVAGTIAVLAGVVFSWDKLATDLQSSRTEQARSAERQADAEKSRAEAEKQTELARAHQSDVEYQIEELKLNQERQNLDRNERAAERTSQNLADQNIAGLVSAAISGGESQLAELLLYSNRDPTHRDLVLAGLEAKSEFLKTPAEVRLLFLLFDRIGVDAVPTVIKRNRTVFENYDGVLWKRFSKQLSRATFLTMAAESAPTNDEIDRQLSTAIDDFTSRMPSRGMQHYAEVTIYERLDEVFRPNGEGTRVLPLTRQAALAALDNASEPSDQIDVFAVNTEFLFQSVRFLSRTLPLERAQSDKLDLQKCFLSGMEWDKIDALHRTVDVTAATIDSWDFLGESKWSQASLQTLRDSLIEMICWRGSYFADHHRFSDLSGAGATTPRAAGQKFGPLDALNDPDFHNDGRNGPAGYTDINVAAGRSLGSRILPLNLT